MVSVGYDQADAEAPWRITQGDTELRLSDRDAARLVEAIQVMRRPATVLIPGDDFDRP